MASEEGRSVGLDGGEIIGAAVVAVAVVLVRWRALLMEKNECMNE